MHYQLQQNNYNIAYTINIFIWYGQSIVHTDEIVSCSNNYATNNEKWNAACTPQLQRHKCSKRWYHVLLWWPHIQSLDDFDQPAINNNRL